MFEKSVAGVTGRKVGRRTLLGGAGAVGLTMSSAIFGQASASAANYACCNLIYPPGSYTTCANNSQYTWYCRQCKSGCVTCACCEAATSSAYYCRPT